MSTRAEIEAALAEAEAELTVGATILTNGYAVPAETEADVPEAFSNLAKARASCLAARTALARLNFAEGKPIAYRYERRRMARQAASEKAHTNRRKANTDRRRARSALANLNRAELIVKNDKLMTGAVNDPNSGTTASPSNPAWQAVELSSLTLAYLLYYFIDVNLQIAMLPPSVGSLLVG
jgi:hypothetical protein